MKTRSLISIFLSLLISQLSHSQPLTLSGSEMQGAVVVNLETGKTVYEFNADKFFTPASLTKIITTSYALNHLGADFRYETKVYYNADNQSLTVVGSGDPTFNSKYFPNHKIENFAKIIAENLKGIGVTHIGKIVADISSEKSPEAFNSKRLSEDVYQYYGALPHALNIFDNSFSITLKSTNIGDTCNVVSSKYLVKSAVLASSTNLDSAYVYYQDGYFVTGSIPAHRDEFVVRATDNNPNLTFLQELRNQLIINDIGVSDNLVFGKNTSNNLIATDQSPTLLEICYQTNHYSVNLFADALYLLAHSDNNLIDGSGLSITNKATPREFANILVAMDKDNDFIRTLATSQKEGTLRNFPLSGVVGKTGTMSGITALCGYYGKYAFCIIVNNHTEKNSEVRKKMAEFLSKYSKD